MTGPSFAHRAWSALDEYERESIASKEETDSDTLVILAKDKGKLVRAAVAENPSAPAVVLHMLSDDHDVYVRSCVAENQSAKPQTLAALARDEDKRVRERVAENPNTPSETLDELITLSSFSLSMWSAAGANPSTSAETLRRIASPPLFMNDVMGVVSIAATHTNMPPDVLASLATIDDYVLLRSVAQNPSTPPEAFAALMKRGTWSLLSEIARNTAAPVDVLRSLARDSDFDVVLFALVDNPSTPSDALMEIRHLDPEVGLAAREEARARICERFSIDPRNEGAINDLIAQSWWEMDADDPAVLLALAIYPGPGGAS